MGSLQNHHEVDACVYGLGRVTRRLPHERVLLLVCMGLEGDTWRNPRLRCSQSFMYHVYKRIVIRRNIKEARTQGGGTYVAMEGPGAESGPWGGGGGISET